MPETARSSHQHHSRRSNRSSVHKFQTNYLEPVIYFSCAIIMIIVAKLLHVNILSPTLGALGLTLLAVSNNLRSGAGVLISVACILLMVIVCVWQWASSNFLAVFSAEVTLKPILFLSGLLEGMILTVLMWLYHRQFKAIQLAMGHRWFGKRSYLVFLKLLFYFQLFLFLLRVIAYGMLKVQPLTHLNTQDAASIAGALALLASGIPAIIYLSKNSRVARRSRYHRHHHRYDRNGLQKNADPDKK